MVNTVMLKEYAEQSYGNVECFAKKTGINPSTFYRKLNSSGNKFTVGDVHKMIEMANMPIDVAMLIFFG